MSWFRYPCIWWSGWLNWDCENTRLEPYTKNPLKKVQKANKGFFRDQGLLHYLLKINDLDQLFIHPVAESSSAVLPFEIKLNSMVNRKSLRGLELFMKDVKSSYGIVINRGKRVELLTDRIIQVPVQYI